MPATTMKHALSMSADTWQRHANPWSVYTRFLSLPLLALAGWSRDWIGWWSLAALLAVALWIWINPRLFPAPASTDNWASKSVQGEQLWLNRKAAPIPSHHVPFAVGLAVASGIGSVQMAYGVLALDSWMVSYGMIVSILTKAWFLDRMVWLAEEMNPRQLHPAVGQA